MAVPSPEAFVPNKGGNAFTATISGNTISGSVPGQFSGEGITFTITRSSTGTPGPAILNFSASPSMINAGDSSTLSWSTFNAGSVSIDNGVGTQNASGNVTVSPTQTTTYKLTATGAGGSATATATVTVAAVRMLTRRRTSASLASLAWCRGSDGEATDLFALTNVGGTATDVTLSASGSFFTISPSSFALAPNSTQRVTITGLAQSTAGFSRAL
jgi:hypothetical protein